MEDGRQRPKNPSLDLVIAVEEKTKDEAVLRPPSAIGKVTPGTRRILTLMVMETLALAQRSIVPVQESPPLPEKVLEDAESLFQTGEGYFRGTCPAQDYAEAVKWYRRAADRGHAGAQVNLGYCYHEGLGVPQDYAEAVKWYRMAAEQGSADAENNLGNCYYYGRGVSQDYVEAVRWYRKAADHGHADAEVNLRVLLLFRARRPPKSR